MVTRVLRQLEPERYVRLDIGYDNRLRDVTASVTHLPFPSGSIDLLICFHVLEHVPDDTRAMRELARVLAPGGLGIIQVPWRPRGPTEEDLEADVDERIRRFGQHDHVRMYGDDFEQILMAQGLSVHRVNPRALYGARAVAWLGLKPEGNNIWIVQPAGAPALSPRADPLQTRMSTMLDTMLGALADESAAADRERERVRRTSPPAQADRGARAGEQVAAAGHPADPAALGREGGPKRQSRGPVGYRVGHWSGGVVSTQHHLSTQDPGDVESDVSRRTHGRCARQVRPAR